MMDKLTPAEINTPLWEKLAAHFAEELLRLREMNDSIQPEQKTAHTRGRIEQLKELLELAKPLTAVDGGDGE